MLLFAAWSCKKDDGSSVEIIPPRLLTEVQPEDDAKIKAFLETHFYNYEEFENPPVDFDYKIRLDTLAGDNAGKTALIDMDELKKNTIDISSEQLNIDTEEESVSHTYYYLVARQGSGPKPTVVDSVFLKYEGRLLNLNLFDESTTFSWQELTSVIRGYSLGIPNLRSGDNINVNDDGTTSIENTGIGMIIMPSGLGYYNSSRGIIPAYAPLIFNIELGLIVEDTDHDRDGVPSILEDLNGDGYLFNDNTDLALEESSNVARVPDIFDTDDDGDGTLTIDEITDENGNIIIPYPDADSDGVPDYLDVDTN